jgi:hypothetical protein
MDKLLITLSRRREVTWPTFRNYVEELLADRPERLDSLRRSATRALRCLGHASTDFSDGPGVVRVGPRVLARLPTLGRPRAVLVGHRLAVTEGELLAACKTHGASLEVSEDDCNPLIPNRFLVTADDSDRLATIARAVEALYTPEPAAWRILHFAGSLNEYRDGLRWERRSDMNWQRRDFDTQAVRFPKWPPAPVSAAPAGSRNGLAEIMSEMPRRSRYDLRQGEVVAQVDRDWGVYAALADAKRHVLLALPDARVATPIAARPPAPIDAALALCSGRVPRPVKRPRVAGAPPGPDAYLVYTEVPHPIAELAARKLCQNLATAGPLEMA